MPRYRFTALDVENHKVEAVIDARDEDDFRRIMRSRSLVPVRFKKLEAKRVSYRLKSNEVAEFSRQLASMLSSGITAVRAMEILKDRDFAPKLTAVYTKMHTDVQKGMTVSEAMRMQERSFPELLINMYASGEASGQLEQVASKMAVHYDKEHRLNGKVRSAMTYPAILAVVTVLVVLAVFIFILPEFFETLEAFVELPALTRGIMAITHFLTARWYLLILFGALAVAVFKFVTTLPAVAPKYDMLKLRAPVIGKLLKIIYTARFARTLSSLYSSGVSMLRALEITSTVIGNKFIELQFEEVIRDVRNGEPLSAAVGKVDGFDKKLATSILIGEEAGRLDSMLVATADSFDYEAEMATEALVKLIEPIMLVIMAAVIGTILISVMSPLMSLYSNTDALMG